MSWLRRTENQNVDTDPVEEPKPKQRFLVTPEFVIKGPTLTTDADGCIVVDITNVPSGVTEIRLTSGRSFTPYPFDIDGERVRNPNLTSVTFHYA